MTSSINVGSSRNGSPFVELVDILRKARDTSGQISIPKTLDVSISQFIQTKQVVESGEVKSIVDSIDSQGSSLCARLSVKAFIVVFAVLRAAEECWGQQRGLYLLTESLQISDDSAPTTLLSTPRRESTPLENRKARIGGEILWTLLSRFSMRSLQEGTRRWVLILEPREYPDH
ncbi:hypothetical protein MMC06_001395 [Schaereria dolodes]|nr:hypothetical protein [Schaereria dolodes]